MWYYRKHHQWIYLIAIVLTVGAHFTPVSYDRSSRMMARGLVRHPRKIDPMELNRELIKHFDFSKMFKQLHEYLSPEEVRIVTTLGLVTGILRAEESMREHLYVLTDDLLGKYKSRSSKENMEKMVAVEKIINRDKSIVKVLNQMLKYARNATTMDSLQMDMLDILKESEDTSKQLQSKMSEMDEEFGSELKVRMKERVYELREMIDNHVEQIHTSITENAKQTIRFIQKMQKMYVKKRLRPISHDVSKMDPSMFVLRRLWDQVAAENESSSSSADDFDVALSYQPQNTRSKKREEEIEDEQQTTESTRQKKPRKKGPRLTKGEEEAADDEENTTLRISRDDDQQIEARISRDDDENSRSSFPSTVKFVMVNTKVDRFKRRAKKVDGKMDVDPFELNVDIDFEDVGDDDDDHFEKPKKKADRKMNKRKDTDDDSSKDETKDRVKDKAKTKAKSNGNEVESFDDDPRQFEKQEDGGDGGNGGDGGPLVVLPLQGGLAGLITNLSGGPMGSDVGTVIAALSSVLNNLFGPGGIDLQGIVGTGATLLASLIGGNQNFGIVLANLLGVMIDGLSGGGGADKNGQFFGQFVGRFISILSADPEDPDDSPIQPGLFIENFYDGIGKGSANRSPDDEEEEGLNMKPNYGSDSSSFIKGVIGGLFSVITSASTNAAAGFSQHAANASLEHTNHGFKYFTKKVKNKFYGYKDYDNDDNNNSDS